MNCCDDYGRCSQGFNCPARTKMEAEIEAEMAARRERIAEEHRAGFDSVDVPDTEAE